MGGTGGRGFAGAEENDCPTVICPGRFWGAVGAGLRETTGSAVETDRFITRSPASMGSRKGSFFVVGLKGFEGA